MKGHNLFIRLLLPAVVLAAAISPTNLNAQCQSGNCQNGTGKYRYNSGTIYTGQFINGQRTGKGKMVYANNNVYEGQFNRNKMHGDGTMYYANGDKYVGRWISDQPNGKGAYYFKTKERYEGDFKSGKFDGQGTMHYPDGAYYTGGWKQNRKNGQGKFVDPTGKVTLGTWALGKLVNTSGSLASNTNQSERPKPSTTKPDVTGLRNCGVVSCTSGKGYYDYPDGSRWIGEFRNGYPHGKGTCYYADGNRYEGEWVNNAPNGEGIMYFASGRVYGAVWVNGAAVKELDSDEQVPANPVRMESTKNVKIWAVVVGVGRYTSMPSLKFTDDDAYRFYTFLRSVEGGALPEEQVAILVDDDATRANILKKMREYFLRADENDVVLLYFSGHGLEGCFLPVDYDGYNNKLRHDEVKQIFNESKAKHKLCIADACHSGSLNYGGGSLAAKGPAPVSLQRYYKAFEDASGGIALLMSSKAEELSLEDHGLRQGVFTYYVLQGLKGNADTNNDMLVSIKELYRYVYVKVREYTGNIQTPVLTGDYDDDMPVAVRQH
ncbi:MAG: caspase family protein [Saprospiraceae bacterium]|nr:caspase family protein [Saprospiraceae bacterium]MCB9355133.1 caspase family protein [Lewinellaceae bacterium]